MNRPDPRLRVYICGRLTVVRGTTVLAESAFPARQGRRLWAYLILHRQQPISREDLATAIWGDGVPDAWDVSLNTLAARLRRFLRPVTEEDGPRLLGESGRYDLRVPPGTVVDFERARAALHRADVLMHAEQWAAALAETQVAAEIAARGFLPGETGVWVEGQRQLLHSIRLHALSYTVEAELRRGRIGPAEREAEQLLALDPLRETSYHLMMRVLAAGGNASGVRRALAECRRVLTAEGMKPSPETERLGHALAGGSRTPRHDIRETGGEDRCSVPARDVDKVTPVR